MCPDWLKFCFYKGLAKLGNIVAKTLFHVMFSEVAKSADQDIDKFI